MHGDLWTVLETMIDRVVCCVDKFYYQIPLFKNISSLSLLLRNSYLLKTFLNVMQIGIVLNSMICIDLYTFRIRSILRSSHLTVCFLLSFIYRSNICRSYYFPLTCPFLTVHCYLSSFCRHVNTSRSTLNYPIFIGIRNQSQYGARIRKIKNSEKYWQRKKLGKKVIVANVFPFKWCGSYCDGREVDQWRRCRIIENMF